MKMPYLKPEDVQLLENDIDKMNKTLPVMKSFILPGGYVAVSHLHVAMCICRRAERICVHMQEEQILIDPLIIKYINRLSDYVFVMARYIGQLEGASEIAWKPRLSV